MRVMATRSVGLASGGDPRLCHDRPPSSWGASALCHRHDNGYALADAFFGLIRGAALKRVKPTRWAKPRNDFTCGFLVAPLDRCIAREMLHRGWISACVYPIARSPLRS